MTIRFHPHAMQRMRERGATQAQVRETVITGRQSPAKFGRRQFRKTFPFNSIWNRKRYGSRQIDAFAAKISGGWLVITVIVKYF